MAYFKSTTVFPINERGVKALCRGKLKGERKGGTTKIGLCNRDARYTRHVGVKSIACPVLSCISIQLVLRRRGPITPPETNIRAYSGFSMTRRIRRADPRRVSSWSWASIDYKSPLKRSIYGEDMNPWAIPDNGIIADLITTHNFIPMSGFDLEIIDFNIRLRPKIPLANSLAPL